MAKEQPAIKLIPPAELKSDGTLATVPTFFYFANSKGGLGKTYFALNFYAIAKSLFPKLRLMIYDPCGGKESCSEYYPTIARPVPVDDPDELVDVFDRINNNEKPVDGIILDSMGTKQRDYINSWVINYGMPRFLGKHGRKFVLVLIHDNEAGIEDSKASLKDFATCAGINEALVLVVFNSKVLNPRISQGSEAYRTYQKSCDAYLEDLKTENPFIPAENFIRFDFHRVPQKLMEAVKRNKKTVAEAHYDGTTESEGKALKEALSDTYMEQATRQVKDVLSRTILAIK